MVLELNPTKLGNKMPKISSQPFTDKKLKSGIIFVASYRDNRIPAYYYVCNYVLKGKPKLKTVYIGNRNTISPDKIAKAYNRALYFRYFYEASEKAGNEDFDPKMFLIVNLSDARIETMLRYLQLVKKVKEPVLNLSISYNKSLKAQTWLAREINKKKSSINA